MRTAPHEAFVPVVFPVYEYPDSLVPEGQQESASSRLRPSPKLDEVRWPAAPRHIRAKTQPPVRGLGQSDAAYPEDYPEASPHDRDANCWAPTEPTSLHQFSVPGSHEPIPFIDFRHRAVSCSATPRSARSSGTFFSGIAKAAKDLVGTISGTSSDWLNQLHAGASQCSSDITGLLVRDLGAALAKDDGCRVNLLVDGALGGALLGKNAPVTC